MAKPAFPQTPQGVTDWEKVFEDPENGLIPVIAAAHTPDALRNCLVVVIKQLFTRQSDELEIARLMRQIDGLFDEGSLPTSSAMALLREIKDHRLEKARQHLAKKARKRKRDRRSETAGKRFERALYKLVKNPRYLLGIFAVMLLILGLLVAAASGLLDDLFKAGPEAQQTAADKGADKAAAPAALTGPMPAPPLEPAPKKKKKFPPTVVLRRMSMPRSFSNTGPMPAPILPILVLHDEDKLSTVCGNMPYLLSMINVALSNALGRKSTIGPDDLDRIGRDLTTQLNDQLGTTAVDRIILAQPRDLKFVPPVRCGLTPPAGREYLKTFVEPQ